MITAIQQPTARIALFFMSLCDPSIPFPEGISSVLLALTAASS